MTILLHPANARRLLAYSRATTARLRASRSSAVLAIALELQHAANLLAAVSDQVRTVDFDGERYDLLQEAERMDQLRKRATEAA